jgi:hypothetical protein
MKKNALISAFWLLAAMLAFSNVPAAYAGDDYVV